MGKKDNGVVFIKESSTSLVTSDENDKPIFERTVRTYKIYETKNQFVIREQFRKKKEKSVLTVKKTRGMTKQKVIKDIQNDSLVVRNKEARVRTVDVTGVRGKRGTLNIVQTNYVSKRRVAPQMVCLVEVVDNTRGIKDYFVGYSKKIENDRPSNFQLNNMVIQCEDMAVQKFIKHYGAPKGVEEPDDFDDSGKAVGLSNLGQFETRVVQQRFQYYEKV